jgi:alanyl-tRNA synthetase
VSGIEPKDLKSLADAGKKQLGSGVVALSMSPRRQGERRGRRDDDLSRFSAVDLVRDRLCSARRQGRRRPGRHGAGRRSGCPAKAFLPV